MQVSSLWDNTVFSISALVSLSKAEVASSINRMGESFTKALAMAMRCFSPPEILEAPSPILVSSPRGRLSINLCKPAFLQASLILSSLISSL